jgi:hypothetical protein
MGELNIVGDFTSPWKSFEEKYADRKRYQPDTQDFLEIIKKGKGGSGVVSGDVFNLLGAIASRERKSISRLNIFTHGDPSFIGLKGKIVVKPDGISSSVGLSDRRNESIRLETLETLKVTPLSLNKKKVTLDQIRDRFTSNGVIVLYACRSAVDLHLLQEMADTFGVSVIAFRDVVQYCLSRPSDKAPMQLKIGLGASDPDKCAEATVFDFHQLTDRGSRIDPSKRDAK